MYSPNLNNRNKIDWGEKKSKNRNPWDDNEKSNNCIHSPGRSEEKGS